MTDKKIPQSQRPDSHIVFPFSLICSRVFTANNAYFHIFVDYNKHPHAHTFTGLLDALQFLNSSIHFSNKFSFKITYNIFFPN